LASTGDASTVKAAVPSNSFRIFMIRIRYFRTLNPALENIAAASGPPR
jgi:hypothetical protein